MPAQAAVHHPLWNNGRRCYSRFFGWAYGDGALVDMYPQLTYLSWPCSAEVCWSLLLAAAAAAALHVLMHLFAAALAALPAVLWPAVGFGSPEVLQVSSAWLLVGCHWLFKCSAACLCFAFGFKAVDLVLDMLRAFHPVRTAKHPTESARLRLAAAAEASLIKTWSETGRLWGQLQRKEMCYSMLFSRFDWFCGLLPAVVAAEQQRAWWRFLACCVGGCCGCWLATAASAGVLASSIAYVAVTATMVVAGCSYMLWRLEG
jgi:hypothetical protein